MYFKEDVDAFFGTVAGGIRFGDNPSGIFYWRKVIGQLVLNAGMLTTALYRLSRTMWLRGWVIPSRLTDRLNEFLTGAKFPGEADFGPGMVVYHPNGTIVSPEATCGARVRMIGAVVMGVRDLDSDPRGQSPTIGDDVVLAGGCKLIGRIHIGDRAQIAANSVVLSDVPDDHIAVGVPAKIIPARAVKAASAQDAE